MCPCPEVESRVFGFDDVLPIDQEKDAKTKNDIFFLVARGRFIFSPSIASILKTIYLYLFSTYSFFSYLIHITSSIEFSVL